MIIWKSVYGQGCLHFMAECYVLGIDIYWGSDLGYTISLCTELLYLALSDAILKRLGSRRLWYTKHRLRIESKRVNTAIQRPPRQWMIG